MNYVKPTAEKIEYEAKDIITASGAATKANDTTPTACTNGTGTGKTNYGQQKTQNDNSQQKGGKFF